MWRTCMASHHIMFCLTTGSASGWNGTGGNVSKLNFRLSEAIQVDDTSYETLIIIHKRILTNNHFPLFLHHILRATYEAEVKRPNKENTAADPRSMACSADIYDLATQSQNRAPTNPNSIMEFMVDCYTSMWQNILRNGAPSYDALLCTFNFPNRARMYFSDHFGAQKCAQ